MENIKPKKLQLKEPLSGFLHLIGALLIIPGTIVLIIYGNDSALKVTSFLIYGSTLFLLFLFGVLYHWLPWEAGGKNQVFRKLDHLAIYSFIAGTYTPFCLYTLHGPWGWGMLTTIWTIALFGIIAQSIYINVWRWLTTTIYIVMGWLMVIAIRPLSQALPPEGIFLLISGGIIYSIGGVIYTTRKPNLHPRFGYHELWHFLVLIGAACHYFVILLYVAMR